MSGKDRSQIVHGRKACWAIFAHRPQDIETIYHSRTQREEVGPLARWASANRVRLRELNEDSLRRVSGAIHHEGLVFEVKPLRYSIPDEALPTAGSVWVALDGVGNPYNVGAILRSCAFFGVERVLVGGVAPGSMVNAGSIRASEGGAESVELLAAESLAPALLAIASRGIPVIGLESEATQRFHGNLGQPPCVLVLGQEQLGLSKSVRHACTHLRSIEGRGSISSLNVSVTAGIALALVTESARGTPAPPELSSPRLRKLAPSPHFEHAKGKKPVVGARRRRGKASRSRGRALQTERGER